MTDQKNFVEIRHAQKAFGTLEVLKDISLNVERGQIVAIIGPSGSGKSTLLRAINDLDPLTGGEIILDGVPGTAMPPWRPLLSEGEALWIARYLLTAAE